jgi:RNA recognition motif-containing protein
MSAGAKDVKVLYSVSLISSFERDGSTLVISNLPSHATDQEVSDLLASTYGELRSVQSDRSGSLIVEFFDIQDAEQAVAEIQTAKPWGGQTSVSSKMRQDYERQKGKELLAIIGSWRQSSKQKNLQQPQKTSFQSQAPSESLSGNVFAHGQNVGGSSPEMSQDSKHSGVNTHSTAPSSVSPMMMQPTPQVVLGPDGQYSYVMVQHQPYPPPAVNQHYGAIPQQLPPGQQHVVSGPHGAYITNAYEGQGYWVQQPPHQHIPNPTVPQYLQASPNRGTIAHQPVVDMRHGQSVPMYTPTIAHNHAVVDSSVSSSNTNTSKRSPSRNKDENDNQHLALDIEIVKSGGDVRTSLMVRNIPNKYTQNMLLSEFTESGHGPGKLDFFYLPIDFRNKCNRGYAFINFVDYADIISFYDTYNGKQWKIFKSEKICCITYARIQGQDSMMKRFQNSALMEKDQEYRPLVFTSDGNIA